MGKPDIQSPQFSSSIAARQRTRWYITEIKKQQHIRYLRRKRAHIPPRSIQPSIHSSCQAMRCPCKYRCPPCIISIYLLHYYPPPPPYSKSPPSPQSCRCFPAKAFIHPLSPHHSLISPTPVPTSRREFMQREQQLAHQS